MTRSTTPLRIGKLRTRIRNYPWGSREFLAALRGSPQPSAEPEAELWIGAHPGAPSEVEDGHQWVPLAAAIESRPEEFLGSDSLARFGPRLPFLMKILAIDGPLSIQLHPNAEQSRAGLEREKSAGIPAGVRTYRDARHKPELAVALTPFEALRGFRPVAEIVDLFEEMGDLGLGRELELLRSGEGDGMLRPFFEALLAVDAARVATALEIVKDVVDESCDRAELAWLGRLLRHYPGDITCLAPLFMNVVELQPGEGIYQPPGMLHSYLSGAAVEIMADSDTVVRAGLTRKPVNRPELLRLLVAESTGSSPQVAVQKDHGLLTYDSPAQEFRLSVLRPRNGPFAAVASSIEIWICTEGAGVFRDVPSGEASVELRSGEALVVPATVGHYEVTGNATLFGASVPTTQL